MMDLLDIIDSKMFLGQEFLTWLWYISEEQGSCVLKQGQEVTLFLDELLVLGPAQGQEGSRVTVKGKEASLAEAREGLRRGKLVDKMRLGMIMGEEEFMFTLNAADLAISSLKMPPTQPGDEPDDQDGLRLERIYLVNQVTEVIDELFGLFLSARLESESGGEMWTSLKKWANTPDQEFGHLAVVDSE